MADDLRPGTLLIAPPALVDPNFRRAIVLLCEHSPDGSFGLVINRMLDVEPADVLEGVENYPGRIALGGPVQTDTLHYLHRHADTIGDAIRVMDDVSWGGSFDLVKEIIRADDASPRTLRFFLGYAGWGAGQLQEEIDAGGWILAPASPEDIFPDDPEALWRTVLRRMGGEYAILANFPDDPRLN